jgi:betaine-aldehyde dehydrogenase
VADLYLDGDWCEAVAGGHREIRCPADGTLVATVSEGTRADTEIAIVAARRAFDHGPWPRTPERERGALLLRAADVIERDAKEFARAESLDTGKRLVESEYDIADVVSCFRYYGPPSWPATRWSSSPASSPPPPRSC